jgi:methionine-gamma-lyase
VSDLPHVHLCLRECGRTGKAYFELAYGLREPGPREISGLIYSRINNPDLQVLEERLCLWDRAEAALVFSSGMSAIATTLLTFLRPGDCIVHSEPVYGGTEYLLHHILPQFGIKRVGFRAGSTAALLDAVEQARGQGPVRMIYVETPANPTNELVDIAACAAVARSAGDDAERALVVVDNTFLGPLWQQPLDQGADLVVYSLTKYMGGHSDLIAGSCLGAEQVIAPVRGMRTILGTMADPMTGWLVMRSLETLKLRMTSSMKNARYVAEFLASHAKVKRVNYLGFLEKGTPEQEIYSRQCEAPGSTFAFEVHGGEAEGVCRAQRAAGRETRGQPRRHGDAGAASGYDDALRRAARRATRHGHHRRHDPDLGGHRTPGRRDCRSAAGAGTRLTRGGAGRGVAGLPLLV